MTTPASGNGKLPPPVLVRAEHAYTRYFIDVDEHIRLTGEPVEFEDLLKPVFWSKNVDRLKRGDILRVDKDGGYDCELWVTWVGPGRCGVKLHRAIVGSELYNELKAAEAAAHAEADASLAASIAPRQETP